MPTVKRLKIVFFEKINFKDISVLFPNLEEMILFVNYENITDSDFCNLNKILNTTSELKILDIHTASKYLDKIDFRKINAYDFYLGINNEEDGELRHIKKIDILFNKHVKKIDIRAPKYLKNDFLNITWHNPESILFENIYVNIHEIPESVEIINFFQTHFQDEIKIKGYFKKINVSGCKNIKKTLDISLCENVYQIGVQNFIKPIQ